MGIEIIFGERVVGEIRADGFFQKRLRFSQHLLQKPRPSIAINVDVLAAAEREGAHSCEIIDAESGKHYRATIAKIRARGFDVNRGQGAQIALPLAEWDTDQVRADAVRLTADARQIVEPTPRVEQLTFWG